MSTSLDSIYEAFEFLDEWMDRYKFLIELGRKLAPLTDDERVEANRVHGCMSQVWLVMDPMDDAGRLTFRADSDAHIVKGLIAVALALYNEKSPAEIAKTDPDDVYKRLGLDQHLTVNRRNGFVAMMGRIKALAAEAA